MFRGDLGRYVSHIRSEVFDHVFYSAHARKHLLISILFIALDVCDLLVPLASRKGLELIILVDDTLPLAIIGDPDRMKQILMNLIGNAIKFSTTGNVVIEFHHELVKRAVVTSSPRATKTRTLMHTHGPVTVQPITKSVSTETDENKLGDEVVLHCSVKDQGIGLSPEEQKMLFVSFQQTDNGTTRKYGGKNLQ